MTGAERLQAAIAFRTPDRLPVLAQVFGHAAALAGVELRDYLRDGELFARCQLAARDHYDLDAVFALMDANVETEALGSQLRYRQSGYPTIEHYALGPDASGLERLPLEAVCKQGRIPELLKAARLLRKALGDETLVIGCVTGPFTLAAQLMGLEPALYLAIDQAARFAELLDVTTQFACDCSQKQLETGVHAVMLFDPVASPEVVPPQFYREFALPRVREILATQRQHGALFTWVHVTGKTGPILGYLEQTGADLLNVDFSVDLAQASETLPRTCLNGNLKPLDFVTEQPAPIRAQAERLARDFAPRRGYILSPGCEIPPEAQPENVAAMIAAAHAWAP